MRNFVMFWFAATVMACTAFADLVHLTGNLNDPTDPRIVGPGINGSGALFDALDPSVSVNNVVLYSFTLATATSVHFTAAGADVALIDPYLSIFSGLGASASFLTSYSGAAFGDSIDVTQNLNAGNHMVALSAFLNLSFAENLGFGTLGDGFTGLGNFTGGTHYDLTIDTGIAPVPEPSSLFPLVLALIFILVIHRRHRERPQKPLEIEK
jgi:hypothetical protein